MSILEKFRLDGKVALVTGARQGLGQEMAVGLAEAGADIAALDIGPCEETAERVKAAGRRTLQLTCDLGTASIAQLGEVVQTVVKELGGLDILLNNAGIIRRAPVLEFSEKDWDDVIQIDQKAVFFL